MAVVSDVSRVKALEIASASLEKSAVISFQVRFLRLFCHFLLSFRVLDAEIIFVFATSMGCFAGALHCGCGAPHEAQRVGTCRLVPG
jgi:hypothetical protein